MIITNNDMIINNYLGIVVQTALMIVTHFMSRLVMHVLN